MQVLEAAITLWKKMEEEKLNETPEERKELEENRKTILKGLDRLEEKLTKKNAGLSSFVTIIIIVGVIAAVCVAMMASGLIMMYKRKKKRK